MYKGSLTEDNQSGTMFLTKPHEDRWVIYDGGPFRVVGGVCMHLSPLQLRSTYNGAKMVFCEQSKPDSICVIWKDWRDNGANCLIGPELHVLRITAKRCERRRSDSWIS